MQSVDEKKSCIFLVAQQIKAKKEAFNSEVMEMKARKETLLKELEEISLELVDIQYQLKPAKRKPVPTIPIIYIDEQTKDPFEVSTSDVTCVSNVSNSNNVRI